MEAFIEIVLVLKFRISTVIHKDDFIFVFIKLSKLIFFIIDF